MDKLKYVLAIIFIAGFVRCDNSRIEDNDHVEFPNEFYVYAFLDSIKVEPVLFLEKHLVATSQHIVSLGSDDNRLLNVFSASNGEHKGSFGKEGEGPDEFIHIFPSSLNAIGGDLTIGDLTTIRYIENFDRQLLDEEEIKVSYSARYPDDFIPLNYAFFLNDSTVCGQAEVSAKQLSCFDIYTVLKYNIVDYPDIVPKVPSDAKHHLYQNHVKITPDRSKLVFAYSYFPLIRIFEVSDKITSDIYVKSKIKQKEKMVVAPGNRSVNVFDLFSYYSSIAVSDKYIYALYQEMKFEASPENPGEMLMVPLSDKEIHVFSIEGRPTAKLKLEDWMNVYTVTTNDDYLYFVHPEKEYYLFRLPLDQIIKKG